MGIVTQDSGYIHESILIDKESIHFWTKLNNSFSEIKMPDCMSNLLRVVLLEGEHGGDVEHDLNVPPLRVDAVGSSQVVDGVEAT